MVVFCTSRIFFALVLLHLQRQPSKASTWTWTRTCGALFRNATPPPPTVNQVQRVGAGWGLWKRDRDMSGERDGDSGWRCCKRERECTM